MSISETRIKELNGICQRFRNELVDLLYNIQTGHPGGSLSCTEILVCLYFEKMTINPKNPYLKGADKFVLSKGHAAPMLYITLAERGFFPKSELSSLRQIDSRLQGHPCAHKTMGIDCSTGPLGLGLSAALGMALSEKLKESGTYVYTLLGDGEIQEGIIWETLMAASKFKADNLITILDNNGVQLDGPLDEIMPMGDIALKFTSFGWNVLHCDGHDIRTISNAIDQARKSKNKPSIIIASTIKGKGISFMEGKNEWHGKQISDTEYRIAKSELRGVHQ